VKKYNRENPPKLVTVIKPNCRKKRFFKEFEYLLERVVQRHFAIQALKAEYSLLTKVNSHQASIFVGAERLFVNSAYTRGLFYVLIPPFLKKREAKHKCLVHLDNANQSN